MVCFKYTPDNFWIGWILFVLWDYKFDKQPQVRVVMERKSIKAETSFQCKSLDLWRSTELLSISIEDDIIEKYYSNLFAVSKAIKIKK